MNETTRTYPRTMREAFPFEAQIVERYTSPSRMADRAVNWILAIGVIVVIFVVIFGGQP